MVRLPAPVLCQLLRVWAAMALLTRLVPASQALGEQELTDAVPWYPAAGAAVGLVAILPLMLGLGDGYALIQAWCYLLVCLWATRCLHWDGLADVADAWGSNTTGQKFQTILKDSRTGAFGALALAMGVLGQTLLVAAFCADKRWLVLVLAPIIGRIAAIILAVCAPVHPASTLGRLLGNGATPRTAWVYGLLTAAIIFALFDWRSLVLLAGGLLLVISCLARLARREHGLNGDFFGASIVLGELVVLLACL